MGVWVMYVMRRTYGTVPEGKSKGQAGLIYVGAAHGPFGFVCEARPCYGQTRIVENDKSNALCTLLPCPASPSLSPPSLTGSHPRAAPSPPLRCIFPSLHFPSPLFSAPHHRWDALTVLSYIPLTGTGPAHVLTIELDKHASSPHSSSSAPYWQW
jgi:hypothetical protein